MRKRRGIEGAGGEFFICFTSRLSSSSSSAAVGGSSGGSMRVPSTKSLMSPGRSSSSVPSLSLSSSLTRRLRSSGSVKGGQSPMFPTSTASASASSLAGRKKRGCAFEAAEPSSPKVTCIGQVRVKSKKKKLKQQQQQQQAMMARSRSRDASFRRSRSSTSGLSSSRRGRGAERACLPIGSGRNQRWMHQLPLSICEALKSFGCEFNCFSTSCAGNGGERSGACFSFSDADKRDKKSSSYTATAKEDEGREVLRLVVKERETLNMGLLVRERDLLEKQHGEEDQEEETVTVATVVKTEMDINTEEVEKGRVSVCIPPKNALLLMRCRSDPVRMAALANKFWGSPVVKIQCEKEDDDEDEEIEVGVQVESDERVHTHHLQEGKEEYGEGKGTEELADSPLEQVLLDARKVAEEEDNDDGVVSDPAELEQAIVKPTDLEEADEETEKQQHMPGEKKKTTGCEQEDECGHVLAGEVIVPRLACGKDLKSETRFVQREKEGEIKGRRRSTSSCSSTQSADPAKAKEVATKRRGCYSKEKKERRRHSFSIERESRRNSFSSEKEARRSSFSVDKQSRKRWSFSLDKEDLVPEPPTLVEAKQQLEVDIIPLKEKATEVVEPTKTIEEAQFMASKVRGDELEKSKGDEVQCEERKRRELPDCLLLMMYESKLSMEVSKETWVCSSDFLRWRPNHNLQPQHHSSVKGKVVQVEEGSKCNETSDDCKEGKEATPVVPKSTVHHPPTPPRPSPPQAAPPPSSLSGSEQKLLKSCGAAKVPYEPFVLTRCKSEPLKSSARLAPDWFWKSRHEPIGAAGVGF